MAMKFDGYAQRCTAPQDIRYLQIRQSIPNGILSHRMPMARIFAIDIRRVSPAPCDTAILDGYSQVDLKGRQLLISKRGRSPPRPTAWRGNSMSLNSTSIPIGIYQRMARIIRLHMAWIICIASARLLNIRQVFNGWALRHDVFTKAVD